MIPLIALTWWQWGLVALGIVIFGIWVIGAFLAGAREEGMRQQQKRQAIEDAERLHKRWMSRSEWEGGQPPPGGPTRVA